MEKENKKEEKPANPPRRTLRSIFLEATEGRPKMTYWEFILALEKYLSLIRRRGK